MRIVLLEEALDAYRALTAAMGSVLEDDAGLAKLKQAAEDVRVCEDALQ